MNAPKKYLNLGETADVLRMSMTAVRRRYETRRMPDPDVYLGTIPGWLHLRIERFARHTGRITDGQPPRSRYLIKDYRQEWWRMDPRHYATLQEISIEYNLSYRTVMRAHKAGKIRPPEIQLGKLYGWDIETFPLHMFRPTPAVPTFSHT